MGPGSSIANMELKYKDARLPHPEVAGYKNGFEKEFFMVVNLLRSNPDSFVPHVKSYASVATCRSPQACTTVANKLKEVR